MKSNRKSIYPPSVRFLRIVFPIIEILAPGLAARLAVFLFLTPVRFGFTPAEKEVLKEFRQGFKSINGKRIAFYEVGEGPTLLLLHGWSGRGMQFRVLAQSLAASGFHCVLIDAPGHGRSDGKQTNLFEFSEVFNVFIAEADNLKAVIGHSLGAASISYAIANGTQVPAFITLGAPVIAQDILDTFTNTLNASKRVQKGIRKKAVAHFGETFQGVAMETTFRKVQCPVLSLHGANDHDVDLSHLDKLKSINPQIDALVFSETGHRRILRDERVVEAIIDWLKRL
ncbi:MAG: alpha/beta hydrolase [Salibacteraceae bacterium]